MTAILRGPAHATTLPGWMDDGELEWLAAGAAGRDLVVEFGAWWFLYRSIWWAFES